MRKTGKDLTVQLKAAEAIIAAMGDGLSIQDTEFRILYQNRIQKEIIGDHVGEYCYRAYEQREEVCEGCPLALAFADGKLHKSERANYTKDEVFYVGITASPIRDTTGRIIAGIEIVRDITDRKLAERELAAEKERLEVTLGSIGDAVIATDTAGDIVLMNRVAEELTGWSRHEAAGKPLAEVLHFVDEMSRTRCESPPERASERDANICLESHMVLVARDGTERLIADSCSPIRDESGQIIGTVLVFRDITEKRKIAAELLNAKKLEAVAILSAGIAHEINNPLTNASLKIQLIKERSAGNRYLSDNLEAVERSIDKASAIAKELLDFSRQRRLELVPLNITDIIDSALASLAHKLGGITVTREIAPASGIYGDPLKLEQVFINIFTNAIEAMSAGGEISLSVSESGGMVRVRIADTGGGIANESLSKVFDPFYTTKDVGAGTGLGLSICYGIIMQHRGSIEVRGNERRGTVVTITLPAGRSVV